MLLLAVYVTDITTQDLPYIGEKLYKCFIKKFLHVANGKLYLALGKPKIFLEMRNV